MSTKIIRISDRIIEFCLYSLIFCLPFSKAAVEMFTWTAIFFWFLKRERGYRTTGLASLIPSTPLNKALAVLIVVNALATILSVNFGLSFRAFLGKELKFIVIYFMVAETINNEKRLKHLLVFMTLSAILITADAAAQYFRGVDFLRGYSSIRLQASFFNPNNFAGWLIMLIPAFGGLVAMKEEKSFPWKIKVLLAALIFLLLGCLFFTYSRGAWLGTLAGFFLGAYYFVKKSDFKKKVRLLLIFTGLLIIFLFFPQMMKARISLLENLTFRSDPTMKQRLTSSGGAVVRTKLWKESLSIIEDFPLLGAGLNTYSRVAQNYKVFEGGGTYPHNSFLQMAAETGILGLLSFLWILFEFFKYAWRYVNERGDLLVLGLMSGILAFLVQSFVDTNLYALQMVVLFWFMLGLTVAVMNLGSKELPQSS